MGAAESRWFYEQHAKDLDAQLAAQDADLFPGRMNDEHLAQMPMTYCMTFEHDFLRRDTITFAKRLHAVGKLAGFSDMAGYEHGCMLDGRQDDAERFYNGFAKAINEGTA